ncbi:MAG: hypothetical protein JWQ84_1547 [Mucilaginibacter sp.]|nr:hypothetical protein [Mucilaginibacter sp.]
MERKFNIGDVVVMIADGPKMAVEGYALNDDNTESDEYVSVVFFAGDGFKRDTFHQDLLLFIDEVQE